jgi:hypothetical protein
MIVAEDVEHACPCEAQDERRVDHAEHDRRQHQMMQAIAQRHAGIAVARDGKPAEADRKDLHQDQAEPEAGDARAQHGESRKELIDGLAAPDRGDDAAGNADQRRDDDRKESEEKGRLGALEQRLSYRSLQKDRLAQVAMDQLRQPIAELQRQRLVEPVGCAQLRDVGRGRLIAQHDRRRIAGCEPRDEKDNGGHQQHHDHHAAETRGEIPGHAVGLQPNLPLRRSLTASLPRKRARRAKFRGTAKRQSLV